MSWLPDRHVPRPGPDRLDISASLKLRPSGEGPWLSYKEYDNALAVEIVIKGFVSTQEFEDTAKKLEAFIARHGKVNVLEVIEDFEGMGRHRILAGFQIQSCSSQRFQPLRYRERWQMGDALVGDRCALLQRRGPLLPPG
jgi:hypothetical protein